MARKHITRGIEALVFGGKVKYIRTQRKDAPALGKGFPENALECMRDVG